MIPALREAFNRNFRPETYQQFLQNLEASAGAPIAFRVSETPCFLPKALLDQMAGYGRDLVLQLVAFPDWRQRDVITATLGGTTKERMLPKLLEIAQDKWGIDPERSLLIGVVKIESAEVAN